MKKSHFTEQQIAFALQQAESGTAIADVCRKLGISEQTFYRWNKRYGAADAVPGAEAAAARGRKRRLKRIVADLTLDKEMLQEDPKRALTPARRRETIDHLRACYRASIRRARWVLEVNRSTYQYRPKRTDQTALEKGVREIAAVRVRYGYKRIHVMLRREGWRVNHKRVHRLYCAEGLQMRHKTPRRQVSAKLLEDRCTATATNECWSMDLMHDELFDGRRIRLLAVVDNFSRVSPVIGVRSAYRRRRRRGGPKSSSKGARDAEAHPGRQRPGVRLQGAGSMGVPARRDLDFSRAGKPADNAFIESFNGSLHKECPNQSWFLSLEDARKEIEAWRIEYIGPGRTVHWGCAADRIRTSSEPVDSSR